MEQASFESEQYAWLQVVMALPSRFRIFCYFPSNARKTSLGFRKVSGLAVRVDAVPLGLGVFDPLQHLHLDRRHPALAEAEAFGGPDGRQGLVQIELNGNPTLLLADNLFFTHYRYHPSAASPWRNSDRPRPTAGAAAACRSTGGARQICTPSQTR